jgi:hypothetical protein
VTARIWVIEAQFATYLRFAGDSDAADAPISVTHFVDPDHLDDFAQSVHSGAMADRPDPAAELVLRLDDFDVDYFQWGGFRFVSERMRRAMALDPSAVRFFNVDARQSARLPRSMNYQIMDPTVTEEMSDPNSSEYELSPLLPNVAPIATQVDRIAFRPDMALRHDLFHDHFFATSLYCTDRFARRVLEAGCTGMTFVDPNSGSGDGALIRTRRGIEKRVEWDLASGAEITELVEALD